jgi:hypothetical protein
VQVVAIQIKCLTLTWRAWPLNGHVKHFYNFIISIVLLRLIIAIINYLLYFYQLKFDLIETNFLLNYACELLGHISWEHSVNNKIEKEKKNITHTALGFLNAASLSATAARSSPLLMQTAIFKIVLSLL